MGNDILNNVKLLYIDNDKRIVNQISKLLLNNVKELNIAKNHKEGIQKFITNTPDIIIANIKIDSITSNEMLLKIRKIDKLIPIIIISSKENNAHLLQVINLNINGYLSNDFKDQELLETLENSAKLCFFEQTEKKNNEILQQIMNTNEIMQVVCSFNKITFANKSFLKLLSYSTIDDFHNEYENLSDIFLRNDYYPYDGLQNTEQSFIDYLINLNPKDRIVMIYNKKLEEKEVFYVKLSLLDISTQTYLWSFTNITHMAQDNINMEYKAYHDPLTKIYNRAKINEVINQEIERYKRYKEVFTVALIDIDHFKKVNDTHGHLIGDEILISMAQACNLITRNTDTFARWGGEEFLVLFTNTSQEESIKAVMHLQKTINTLDHKIAGKITASFGLSQVIVNDSIDTLLKRADLALYKAKENGRNCYEIY